MANPVTQTVRPEIQSLTAYHVAPATGMVKLDAMENPYRWPQAMVEEWLNLLRDVQINRYPDPATRELKADLRRLMGVKDDYAVLLGNGSDELIQIIALALAKPGSTLLAVEPSFVMYKLIATICGMAYRAVPLAEDFRLDLAGMLQAMEETDPALLFLAQPNNPTGNLFSLEEIEQICAAASGLVVIDEAYFPFTDRDHLMLIERHDNVVVMRTLSKMGLAGLRLGMLFGRSAWLDQFEKLRLPYNVNVLTEASVKFALKHYDVLKAQTQEIRENRALLTKALMGLPFNKVWSSEANFVLTRTDPGRAQPIFEQLKAAGILVKCLAGGHPQLQDCLRFTVGTTDENHQLIQTLKQLF